MQETDRGRRGRFVRERRRRCKWLSHSKLDIACLPLQREIKTDDEDRKRLTAQDSHVEPGVDVGQLILQRHRQEIVCVGVGGVTCIGMQSVSFHSLHTYIKHGGVSTKLHQVLAQFALVFIQHV